jgi:putative transposase
MPRALRLIVDHECYHVINRANAGQLIFRSPPEYQEYQALLEKYSQKFGVRIYHYVLMPNHVHLLLEPTNGDLPRFMQGLTLAHTRRTHRRQKTYGHIWQGRYKSLHVDKDAYFLQCAQYIELNPVRAGIVTDPSEYPWSSYHVYVQGLLNSIVTQDQFYLALGKTLQERQAKYMNLMANAPKRT